MIEFKYCAACFETLLASAFSKNKRRVDGLDTYCRECSRAKRKLRPRRPGVQVDMLRIEHQRRMTAYKASLGCCRCGERDPIVLEFHHRDPNTKKATIGRLATRHDLLPEELAKCDLICANCHRKEHRERHERHLLPLLDEPLRKFIEARAHGLRGFRVVTICGLPVDKSARRRDHKLGWQHRSLR